MDVAAGATQDVSSAFLLRCLPSFFSREGFRCAFPSSKVRSNFVYVLHLLGIFYFFVSKNLSSCDDTEIRTHVPTSESFEVTN